MFPWTHIEHLDHKDFMEYVDTLPDKEKIFEIKKHSRRMLKDEMRKYISFYNFIEKYSPRDFKIIKGKKYVSQRVIREHVKYWNQTHPFNTIKKLRIFFY